ncbi:MAG: thioredoxin family protein [Nanoarchaeota archaeon]|nr:thioredoxin family protein [Nanoarchaeota archaeon]
MARFGFYAGLCSVLAASCAPAVIDQTPGTPSAESAYVQEIGPEDFSRAVIQSEMPVAVKFYARWCRPCRELAPVFEEACMEMEGRVKCFSYNTDQETDNGTSQFGADGVPSITYYCNGRFDQIDAVFRVLDKDALKIMLESFLERCQ